MQPMRWCFLGRVDYDRALRLQLRLRGEVARGAAPDTLLLLEHPPVITLGRSGKPEHVLIDEAERRRRGVALAPISRGGDVTYHGPGQLVGYPVRRVGRMVKDHVRAMADAVVALLAGFGLAAWWREDTPGVWCGQGKIGAIGVDAQGGVAIHGFALNLRPRLADFAMIVPCGLSAPVTSVAAVLGEAATPTLEDAARRLGPDLCRRFRASPVELVAEALGEVAA